MPSPLSPSPQSAYTHACPCFLPAPQARFTEAILRRMAGIHFPMDRIFSQTVSGQPKSEVRESSALCVFLFVGARRAHMPLAAALLPKSCC